MSGKKLAQQFRVFCFCHTQVVHFWDLQAKKPLLDKTYRSDQTVRSTEFSPEGDATVVHAPTQTHQMHPSAMKYKRSVSLQAHDLTSNVHEDRFNISISHFGHLFLKRSNSCMQTGFLLGSRRYLGPGATGPGDVIGVSVVEKHLGMQS